MQTTTTTTKQAAKPRPGQSNKQQKTTKVVSTVVQTTKKKNNNSKKNQNSQTRGLAACTKLYYQLIRDAWSTDGRGACIPSGLSPPSQKVVVDTYDVVTTGADGLAFWLWCPSPWSNINQILKSNSTTPGTAIDISTTAATAGYVTQSAFSRLPYSSPNAVGAENRRIKARIVAAAAGVTYESSPLYRAGHMTYGHSTMHQVPVSVTNPISMTYGDLQATAGFHNGPVDSSEHRFTCHAVEQDELDYPEENAADARIYFPFGENPTVPLPGVQSIPIAGFAAVGAPAGSTWHVRMRFVIEYAGMTVASSLLTPSHADVVGLATVMEAVQSAGLDQNATSFNWSKVLDKSLDLAMKHAVPAAMNFARSAAPRGRTRLDRLEL